MRATWPGRTARRGAPVRATLVAGAVATAVAAGSAWGHSFPPVRTVVLQVERCEAVLLVGYRPASGEETELLLKQAASQPKSRALPALEELMATRALAPLSLRVAGKPLVPTSVRTKIGVEQGGARPMVVVLVTYALPDRGSLALATRDPRTTRISWTDRDSGRVAIADAPAQGRWFTGVASFLLDVGPTSGGPACARTPSHSP